MSNELTFSHANHNPEVEELSFLIVCWRTYLFPREYYLPRSQNISMLVHKGGVIKKNEGKVQVRLYMPPGKGVHCGPYMYLHNNPPE